MSAHERLEEDEEEANGAEQGQHQRHVAERGGAGGAVSESEFLTVDGSAGLCERDDVRKWARNMLYGGFLGLPWLWGVAALYLSPVLRGKAHDSRVAANGSRAAALFAVATVATLAWAVTFLVAGESLLGTARWKELSITGNEFLREVSAPQSAMIVRSHERTCLLPMCLEARDSLCAVRTVAARTPGCLRRD